jgi:hypothetical protein
VVAYGAPAVSLVGCGAARSALSGAVGGVNRGVSDAAGNAAAGAVTRRFGGPSVPGAPAGNFTATHVRYSMMGGGTYERWLAEGIPGGVAKYVVGYQSDSYTQALVAMARDARTELGSY